ncbi:MAG: hypothetical protein M3O91_06845 [Chloroflexota bacterium]|nr:hypothetical protein [Chloroflexota bacterium]
MQIIGGVVLAIAIAGGGFIAGMTTAQARGVTASPSPTPATGRGGAGGQTGAGGVGAANANRGVTGQIIAVNTDSITIMTRTAGQGGASPTAGSAIVLVGQGTRVVKATETDIKLGDLKAGDQVTVVGTPDTATGTISAQAVVLGGANVLQQLFGGAGGAGGGRGGASPSPSPTR